MIAILITAGIILILAGLARRVWTWANAEHAGQPGLSEREVADRQRSQTNVLATPLRPPVNGDNPIE